MEKVSKVESLPEIIEQMTEADRTGENSNTNGSITSADAGGRVMRMSKRLSLETEPSSGPLTVR
jgi:hypothetical protein